MSQKSQPTKRTMISVIICGVPEVQVGAVAASIDRAGSRPQVIFYTQDGQKLFAEALARQMNAHAKYINPEVLTDATQAIAWSKTCDDDVAIIAFSQNAMQRFFRHIIGPATNAGQIFAKFPHTGEGDIVSTDSPKRKKERSTSVFLNGHRQGIIGGKVVNVDKNGKAIAVDHGQHGHGPHSAHGTPGHKPATIPA